MFKISHEYVKMLTTAIGEKGVKFQTGGGWEFDIKKRILTYNPRDLENMPPELIKGLLIHESGHILDTRQKTESKLEAKYPAMHDLHNALEDIRIEDRQRQRYGDFASESLGALNDTLGLQIAKRLEKERDDRWNGKPPSMSKYELATYGIAALAGNNQYRSSILNGIEYLEKDVYFALQNNFSEIEDVANEVKEAQSTDEVNAIVDKRLYPIVKDFIDSKEKPHAPPSKAQQMAGKGAGGNNARGQKCPTYDEAAAIVAPYAYALARKLAQVLAENARPKFTGRYKSGKLKGGRAVDVCLGNERPFMRGAEVDTQRYKFIVALDASGSMEGAKALNSYLTAVMLGLVSNKLGFPFHSLAFNHSLEEHEKQSELGTYGDMLGGGTNDSAALEAIETKHVQYGDGSIVFIVGDGDGQGKYTNEPIFARLKKKQAHVFGIGLNSESVLYQYPNAVNVHKPEELTAAIITKITSIIHRQVLA